MDFELTDEQRSLRASIVEFGRRELNEDLLERDKNGTFSRDAWKKCAGLGILGLPVPEEYGGTGADATTTMVALEALGYACTDNGLLFSLNAQMWAIETPIIRFGSDEQKQRYLPGLADGSIVGAHGMSEPASGSDAFSLSTTARSGRRRLRPRRLEDLRHERARERPLPRLRDDRQGARVRRRDRVPASTRARPG